MAVQAILLCVQLSLVFSVAFGGIVEICYNSGAILEGKLHLDGLNVMRTNNNTRSRLECATMCHANSECLTAVYRSDGDCLLIKNYTNVMTYDDSPHSYTVLEEILEMKTEIVTEGVAKQMQVTCPSECTSYSVCLADCTALNAGGVYAEPGCIDISSSQYNTDGCGFRPSIQMKEYYLNNLDKSTNADDYDMFSVQFVKKFDWTTLQVKFRGTLRSGYGHTTGTWGLWRILFNGNDCGSPGHIESTDYNQESDTNHHKASGIIGICNGLTAGTYSISLRTDRGTTTEFRVGYATHASRFFVEEFGQSASSSEPPVKPCPSLSSMNFREDAFTTEWSDEPSITLWNMAYTKMEADTWLKINVDLVIRNYAQGTSSSTCATYFIKIDGFDCKPWKYGKTLANLDYANEVNNEHRTTEFEGHCEEISAGYHTINLYLGTCDWGTGYKDIHTGWNSHTNRIIVEEFRPGSNIMAVMDSNGGTLYSIPQFNMVAHGAGQVDDGTDVGEISWVIPTYNKIYRSSGVRVALSYTSRVYWGHGNSVDYDSCCRHYIKFNGVECIDPGTIEGINSLNKRTNLYRPNIIEGVCEGIEAGDVEITIWAGICKGFTKKGDCSFGWNSYQHMLISETFSDREIIQY